MQFLQELLRLCKNDGVKVLIYQPPHPRSDGPFQYDLDAYRQCYATIKELSNEGEGIYFMDFESTVDLGDWGLDGAGRLDVFHFKNQGHVALSRAIFDFIQVHPVN